MKYKYRNSKFKKIIDFEDVKGSIFVFRNKKDMTFSKGVVLTSREALLENKENISHWTPNVYRYGAYADENRIITKGHFEENLRQINTFFLDFDSKDINECDILSVAYELGFLPTFILKSERGYQAYFVLENPVYITKNSNFKAIEVAKIISNNLREYFCKENLPVDRMCNHFGIARFPTQDNIVFFNENNTYNFLEWINWSEKYEDRLGKKDKELIVISGSKGIKQIDEKWFSLLLNVNNNVKGQRNLLGRNNILFTLALACYSSGVTQEECEGMLLKFNNNLESSLSDKEYTTIIKSAYSSKYTAANRDYIIMLCKSWIDEELTAKDLFTYQVWSKFKKNREDRVRSHYYEWEKDVLELINRDERVYVEITKKKIINELNIPKRSLDIVLKNLKDKNVIYYSSTSGRGGGLKIALIKNIYAYIIKQNNEKREKYVIMLAEYFNIEVDKLNNKVIKYLQSNYKARLELFERDDGGIGNHKGII